MKNNNNNPKKYKPKIIQDDPPNCQYTLQTKILIECHKKGIHEYQGKKYCSLHYETVRR